MATEYQDQAARLGEAPELGDEPPAVEVGAVNGGRAWQLNHVDNSGDQENAGCEHQDFSNVEAGEEKHSAHGVPSIKYPTPPGLYDWNCGQNVNMEPRRAAAPHQSHRPEAPLNSVGDSVATAGSTAKEQGKNC